MIGERWTFDPGPHMFVMLSNKLTCILNAIYSMPMFGFLAILNQDSQYRLIAASIIESSALEHVVDIHLAWPQIRQAIGGILPGNHVR
ncbi:hypothetical protein TNCV_4829351 [Trichonephila clavipes]|nr:hypothetical protein TNCV_4829351 [Trichonephila clavipes]